MAKAQSPNTIAFQGEPGANSDMACRAAFPYMTTLPCPTFDAAMGAVQAGRQTWPSSRSKTRSPAASPICTACYRTPG